MKIINGSFVNMLDELENFQWRSSLLNHGWTEKKRWSCDLVVQRSVTKAQIKLALCN
jgi:hypothetical protein